MDNNTIIQRSLFSGFKERKQTMVIKRPLLRYYGSGWARAEWTSSYFPPHKVYCEPCFGAGSVLLHKPVAELEIANDIDGRVINFHTVVREQPYELIEQIRLTPWHEEEYRRCLQIASDNPLEDARRFFFICWASITGGPNPRASDFRWQKQSGKRTLCINDIRQTDQLLHASKRLANVQFLQRDAIKVIKRMHGTQALIYFDPPYLSSTRVRKKDGYTYEVTDEWHGQAATLLRQHDGAVIVSGYQSALYSDLYEAHGWKRVEHLAQTNGGGKAIECLWLNPLTVAYWEL